MRTLIKKPALKTSDIILIVVWIVTVLLIFALLTAFSLIYSNKEEREDPVITTVLNTLNRSIDPCDDFYEFVCGAHAADIITNNTFREPLTGVLNARIAKGEWKLSVLANTFYKSCLTSGDSKDVIEQLKKLGGWPVLERDAWDEGNFTWIDLLHKFRQQGYMEEMLMKFEVVPHLNNSQYIIQISPPKTWMSKEERKQYLTLMVNIFVLLGANRTEAMEQLEESLEFEIKLAKLPHSSTNVKQITSISNLQKQYQSIQWLKLINGILPDGISLVGNNTVSVVGQEYFFNFEDLMNKTSKRVQANYMFWRAVLEKIKYFPKSTYDFYSKTTLVSGVKESRNISEQDCAVETYHSLPYVLNRMYLYYFGKQKIEKALEIVKYLKDSLRRIILGLDWMDGSTKGIALEKLDKMEIFMADYDKAKIEKYYENLEINSEAYFTNVLQVYKNARDNYYTRLLNQRHWIEESTEFPSYLHTENRIFVPATILQSPFYSASFPQYLNFGSLGWIVGSKIIHGFDNTGTMFDDNKKLSSWWSKRTEDKFGDYKRCIINQYNHSTLLDKNVNAYSAIDVHIAYNIGIRLAYSAYYSWLKTHEGKAPDNNKYSPRQLFWIAAVRIWCAPTQDLIYLDTDRYSPNKYARVVGALRNSKEFSAAFNCLKGSKMNPVKKCL